MFKQKIMCIKNQFILKLKKLSFINYAFWRALCTTTFFILYNNIVFLSFLRKWHLSRFPLMSNPLHFLVPLVVLTNMYFETSELNLFYQ